MATKKSVEGVADDFPFLLDMYAVSLFYMSHMPENMPAPKSDQGLLEPLPVNSVLFHNDSHMKSNIIVSISWLCVTMLHNFQKLSFTSPTVVHVLVQLFSR